MVANLCGRDFKVANMVDKNDFFEDIAIALEGWTNASVEATIGADTDLIWVDNRLPYQLISSALQKHQIEPDIIRQIFSECFRGFAVSFLTILDGGTALAEKGGIAVVDENGNPLGRGLHDDFVGYLIDSGRLT